MRKGIAVVDEGKGLMKSARIWLTERWNNGDIIGVYENSLKFCYSLEKMKSIILWWNNNQNYSMINSANTKFSQMMNNILNSYFDELYY